MRLLNVALVSLFCLAPIAGAHATEWQCGAGGHTDSVDTLNGINASQPWVTQQLMPPVAVDRLLAPDFSGQPLRLSDIVFVPQVEAAALRWLARASQAPVDIGPPMSMSDYLDRVPVRLRSHDNGAPMIWQEALLSQGLAMLMPETPDDLSSLIAAEDTAISNEIGMWQDHQTDTAYYVVADSSNTRLWGRRGLADVEDAIGRFVVVDAVLVSVEHQEWRSYLNFGQDWRRDFTIAMGADLRDVLAEPDGSLDAWINRKVRVRGVVENRGGPYIALQNINWLCVEAQ